ncbi:transporter [Defluviimonas sp. D31]|uniref:transporter n=1 Tax=Defluviimonas sp. D31 TaxID=3083253 RepID=UPI00296EC29C|nr:transporter [Defluviimonas sp. D31]MDW4551772.1 transporter [Defluviimonas sp. D31]
MPTKLNYIVGAYSHGDSDIYFDPVLRIENATSNKQTLALGYIRTFEAFGKSARIEVLQGWQKARWAGLLNGAPASTTREGLTDTAMRLSMNLIGAPPLRGEEFTRYRASRKTETILGASLAVQFPTGQYDDSKLLNIGGNRFVFQPQMGVLRNQGSWSFETTLAALLFQENSSFFNGNRLQQEPFYSIEGHATYSFSNGIWVSVGTGYGAGGRTQLNGIGNDDRRSQSGWGATVAYRLSNKTSIKATLRSTSTRATIGEDNQILTIGINSFW